MILEYVGAACIVALVQVIAYRCGFYRFPEMDRSHPPLSLPALLGAYSIALGIMVAFAYFCTPSLYSLVGTQVAICGALIGYLYLFPGIKRAVVRSRTGILFGVISWIVCIPLVGFTSITINAILAGYFNLPHIEQVAVKIIKAYLDKPLSFAAVATTVIFLVPAAEEILLRGFLQTYIKRFVSIKFAIPITSLIFAVLHFSDSQGMQNIDILASLFVLSCFLGYIYERQNSIWAPIALHWTFNAATILMIALKSLFRL